MTSLSKGNLISPSFPFYYSPLLLSLSLYLLLHRQRIVLVLDSNLEEISTALRSLALRIQTTLGPRIQCHRIPKKIHRISPSPRITSPFERHRQAAGRQRLSLGDKPSSFHVYPATKRPSESRVLGRKRRPFLYEIRARNKLLLPSMTNNFYANFQQLAPYQMSSKIVTTAYPRIYISLRPFFTRSFEHNRSELSR